MLQKIQDFWDNFYARQDAGLMLIIIGYILAVALVVAHLHNTTTPCNGLN